MGIFVKPLKWLTGTFSYLPSSGNLGLKNRSVVSLYVLNASERENIENIFFCFISFIFNMTKMLILCVFYNFYTD